MSHLYLVPLYVHEVLLVLFLDQLVSDSCETSIQVRHIDVIKAIKNWFFVVSDPVNHPYL